MKIFKLLIIILILGFLGLYFAYSNGYQESLRKNKVNLTNEKIEKFESDVLNNNDILLENYFESEKDYSTKTSKVSLKVSSKIENIIDSGIKFIFRKLGNMIE